MIQMISNQYYLKMIISKFENDSNLSSSIFNFSFHFNSGLDDNSYYYETMLNILKIYLQNAHLNLFYTDSLK